MIFGFNKVPAVGNSVFVRRPNNLCTGDDPILVKVCCASPKWPSMDLVHLLLLWLATSWLSLQHFQSCHLIVDSVVRTFGGHNVMRLQVL